MVMSTSLPLPTCPGLLSLSLLPSHLFFSASSVSHTDDISHIAAECEKVQVPPPHPLTNSTNSAVS